MLDFYEGEVLRRTILIRNAMRRTEAITQEAQQKRQQQHYHRKSSALSATDTDLFYGDLNASIGEGEPIRHATSSAPIRVQVTDYDYESEIDEERGEKVQDTILEDDEYEDDATEDEYDDGNTSDEDDEAMLARHGHIIEEGVRVSVTSVVKDEHSWFDDLLDEVSIDESKPRSFVQRVHPADQEMEDEDHGISSIESSIESLSIHNNSSINSNTSTNPSLPSLVEDEDESSGSSSADEYDVEDAFAQHYTNRFGKGVSYFGGAELSASTKSHANFTQPSPDTILEW